VGRRHTWVSGCAGAWIGTGRGTSRRRAGIATQRHADGYSSAGQHHGPKSDKRGGAIAPRARSSPPVWRPVPPVPSASRRGFLRPEPADRPGRGLGGPRPRWRLRSPRWLGRNHGVRSNDRRGCNNRLRGPRRLRRTNRLRRDHRLLGTRRLGRTTGLGRDRRLLGTRRLGRTNRLRHDYRLLDTQRLTHDRLLGLSHPLGRMHRLLRAQPPGRAPWLLSTRWAHITGLLRGAKFRGGPQRRRGPQRLLRTRRLHGARRLPGALAVGSPGLLASGPGVGHHWYRFGVRLALAGHFCVDVLGINGCLDPMHVCVRKARPGGRAGTRPRRTRHAPGQWCAITVVFHTAQTPQHHPRTRGVSQL